MNTVEQLIPLPKIDESLERIYIDIGLSWCAPHSVEWLKNDKKCFVIGFEPVEENCTRSMNAITKHGFSNRNSIYQCAVDNVQEITTKKFYITANAGSANDRGQSSLFRLKGNKQICKRTGISMWVEKEIEVVCLNLCEILQQIDWNRFPSISGLKIDTQGNDFNILKSIEPYLSKIDKIACEVSVEDYYDIEDGGDKSSDIDKYLTNRGFSLVKDRNIFPESMDRNGVKFPDRQYERIK